MKLQKAIEILEDIVHYVEPGDPPEEHDAVNLGVEALERHVNRYHLLHFQLLEQLPSETEE